MRDEWLKTLLPQYFMLTTNRSLPLQPLPLGRKPEKLLDALLGNPPPAACADPPGAQSAARNQTAYMVLAELRDVCNFRDGEQTQDTRYSLRLWMTTACRFARANR